MQTKAQDTIVVRDIETWTGISVEKKLFDKKITVSVDQEIRNNDNSSNLNVYFTEVGVEYEFLKNFIAGFGYRFIKDKNKENIYKNKQRYNFDLNYNTKFQRFKLYSRLRYQRKNEFNSTDEAESKFRILLKGKYNIKDWKLDPYVSSEIFIGKIYENSFNEHSGKLDLQKMRFTLGTSYQIKNIGKLNMFYRLEHETGVFSNIYNIPVNTHIIGINYNFSL